MKRTVEKAARYVPLVKRLVEQRDNLRTDIGILQLEKGDLQARINEHTDTLNNPRAWVALRFLRGHGIEIGPSYLPVPLPKGTKVTYVDEVDTATLLKRYPDLKKTTLAPINVVDNAEKLTKFKSSSVDFIIANHFMEHCQDPIGTILNMYRKLRKNGFLFLAIPDKRYTFDINRPMTTYQHLLNEHKNPSFDKKWRHLLEVAEIVEHRKGRKITDRAQEWLDIGYSIHFHVWTQEDMHEMFMRIIRDFKINLEIVVEMKNNHEVIFLLQKGLKQKGFRG